MEHPLKLLYCYASQDRDWVKRVDQHLSLLKRLNIVRALDDRIIPPGSNKISQHTNFLELADLVLLFISPDFLSDEACYADMEHALERQKRGSACVVPIVLRPGHYEGALFQHLQRLPRGDKSVNQWRRPDEVLQQIAEELHRIATTWKASPASSPHMGLPDVIKKDDTSRERETRLKTMLTNHRTFIQPRLESFVGRQRELTEVRRILAETQRTGGYVTITGQAGQGKSSMIAKLVVENGLDIAIHHFIPFTPGPDYQISLLRDLIAQLILKYDLPEKYLTSEHRVVLRDYFIKALLELGTAGKQEVIFIDGLDQIQTDLDGERDLSFLPENPPEGIVLVLGTRPNDTLEPLRLRKPHVIYTLPNLSRTDFDLLLESRNVTLRKTIADQFYQAMQANALYLDLMARELAQEREIAPEEMIQRVTDNPNHIFTLSLNRLQRKPLDQEWREVLKPILGVLLVTREPLPARLIREILYVRQFQDIDAERLRKGLERLGGLVVDDGRHRYTLFHLKLYEYLREDEKNPQRAFVFAHDEEKGWHHTLANWCEQRGLMRIWEDVKYQTEEQGRRAYARRHYITHVYYAQAWNKLFEVLDDGQYGQAKIHRYDRSMRAYAQDIDLGRKVSAWDGWTLEEGIMQLPRLWRYTLLRCSLASRADQYPIAAFELLVLLKRKQEALELAELLTDPLHRVEVLLAIVRQMDEQGESESERTKLLIRIGEVADGIQREEQRGEALGKLGEVLIQAQQWQEAERVIQAIQNEKQKAEALRELGAALIQAYQWQEAERVIRTIWDEEQRIKPLRELGKVLAQAQQWQEAERVVGVIRDEGQRVEALKELAAALVQAQQWQEAERVIGTIGDEGQKAEALGELGVALLQVQQWRRAERVIRAIRNERQKAEALRELGKALVQAQQWQEAERVIQTLWNKGQRAEVLRELGAALFQAHQWQEAQRIWQEAEYVIEAIQDEEQQAKALRGLGKALVQAQQWQEAQRIWQEAERVTRILWDGRQQTEALKGLEEVLIQTHQWQEAERVIRAVRNERQQAEALRELGKALVQAQQWQEAERVVGVIRDEGQKAEALRELGVALLQVQQWQEAERVIRAIWNERQKAEALRELGKALVQAQQWQEAERIIGTIRDEGQKAEALRELGVALLQVQQWKEAERVIQAIRNERQRAEALRKLGKALVQAQQWQKAERVIGTIGDEGQKAEALRELGVVLIQAQQWQEAGRVIRAIRNERQQIWALRELGEALVQAQQWQEAERVIRAIQDEWQQIWALRGLGKALAQAQQWREAERVIRTIRKGWQRAEALRELGTALAQAQQWQEAKRVIRAIQDEGQRAEALRELGTALAQAQQWQEARGIWQEAECVIGSLWSEKQQDEALKGLAKVLTQTQQWQEAEHAINAIKGERRQTQALNELGEALAANGRHELLLGLIHHSWLTVGTRQQAIERLSLIVGFISLYPKLCFECCGAFSWVDLFLRGEGEIA